MGLGLFGVWLLLDVFITIVIVVLAITQSDHSEDCGGSPMSKEKTRATLGCGVMLGLVVAASLVGLYRN